MTLDKRSARIRVIIGRKKYTAKHRSDMADKLRKNIDERSKVLRAG